MTGLNGQRVYLDWNATAPLRPEARAAMLQAMDVVGNPSSVHAEGRAAKAIIEKARGQVAALVGCDSSEIVFTSGATEAAALVLAGFSRPVPGHVVSHEINKYDMITKWDSSGAGEVVMCPGLEHDAVSKFSERHHFRRLPAPYKSGVVNWLASQNFIFMGEQRVLWCLQSANSETGVEQDVKRAANATGPIKCGATFFSDTTQTLGKRQWCFHDSEIGIACASSHKLGGPKGVGALVVRSSVDINSQLDGGGQELGRRSGTENVIGIAGFGAAAEAARRDLEAGVWEPVEKLRDSLEDRLAEVAEDTIFFGKESPRLPNTSCFAVPGWKGETQVMQMDLAGFAVSAGSACSSGKVNKASRVLLAMGFDETTASSAIRVSMGPTTTEAEVMAFADTWIDAYRRRKARAA